MIAESINAFFGGVAARSWDRLDPKDPALARMFGIGNNTRSKVKVDGSTVFGIPAVVRGVGIIGNAMMKVSPSIYRRLPNGDKEPARDHKHWRFVNRRASLLMSSGYLRKTLTSWAITRGNGLAYLERDGNATITGAIPLLPDRSGMAVFRGGQQLPGDVGAQPGDQLKYWTIVGGEIRTMLPENVIHIKGLSHNGYWGMDIIDVLAESFGLSIAPRDFSASFFGQGAMPSGVVFAPAGLKGEAQKDFADNLRKAQEGLGKAHKLLILEESAKFEQISIDPSKASLIATREFERVEIANIIGIQSHKIGDSSRASYNSLEQSNQEHLDDDLDPWLQVWEDELEDKCLEEDEAADESLMIEFNRKALVRVNLAARTARHQFERQNGISTANDILRQENQRPIGEVGDTYMVPANMTVLTADGLPLLKGQAAPETPPREKPPGPPQDEEEGAEEDPESDEEESSDRSAFRELALFEVDRIVTRLCREAVEASRGGGAKFADWLDRLPATPKKPAAIAPLLGGAIIFIHSSLDAFTQPPHTSAELAENVAGAIEAIQAGAIQQAREQLEAHA